MYSTVDIRSRETLIRALKGVRSYLLVTKPAYDRTPKLYLDVKTREELEEILDVIQKQLPEAIRLEWKILGMRGLVT